MKRIFLIGMLIVSASSPSFASTEKVISKLLEFHQKEGKLSSNIPSFDGGRCKIVINQEEQFIEVTFDTDEVWPIAVSITPDAQLIDSNTLLSSDTGKRAGGDACGDAGGSINYKKTVTVLNNSVEIRESMRCLFDFGQKTVLITKCNIN